MKIKQIILPILVLIATCLVTIFIYEFVNNIGTDSLVNITSNNNNVIINHISDISSRNNENITNNLTSNETNSVMDLPNGSSRGRVILAVSIAAFCLVVFGGIGFQAYSYIRKVATAPVIENMELESIPPQFRS